MASMMRKAQSRLSALTSMLRVSIFLLSAMTTSAQVLEQDSLALVAFYHATGGDNWKDNSNWLKPDQNVSTWYGIKLDGNRVHEIILNDNNLTGSLPEEISNLTGMLWLALGFNHLSGTIPASISNMHHLVFLALEDNDYTGDIPSFLFQMPKPGGQTRIILLAKNGFTGISSWDGVLKNVRDISIEDNRLDFGHIEPFLPKTIPDLRYSPQASIYSEDDITVHEGAVLTLKTGTGGSANHYQWFKDGISMTTATQANHTWQVAQADEGEYTAQVTSDIVTGLTLERNPITLHVKEDIIYTSCDGSAITLNAVVSDPQATYLWSNGQTASSIVVGVSGKYGVQIETPNYILKDTIEVVIPPKLFLGPDIDTCEPSVLLSSNITSADTYEWQTPGGIISGESTITATITGRYILEVIREGCVQKDSVEVTLNRFTEGNFTMAAGSAAVENNGTVLTGVALAFTNTTNTGDSFSWSFGDGNASSDEHPVYNYGKAGEYMVTLNGTDSRDCPITVVKAIHARDIRITNAISPNGDGLNDRLYIEPFLYSAELKIINRWGQQVYETSSYNDDFTGVNLESGVYYYDLYLKEIDRRFKGYVHIMK